MELYFSAALLMDSGPLSAEHSLSHVSPGICSMYYVFSRLICFPLETNGPTFTFESLVFFGSHFVDTDTDIISKIIVINVLQNNTFGDI